MRLIGKLTSSVSLVGAYVAGLILCAMTMLILVEIVLRTFFATSTFVTAEFVGYGVAAMSFIGLGHALEQGALIRVNLVLAQLGSGAVRRVFEAACIGVTAGVVGVAIWYFAKTVIRNYERGYVSQTTSNIPSWIPETFVLAGLAVFLLQLLAYLIQVLTGGEMLRADEVEESGS